ncbi:MAG: hypothetical protein A2Y17_07250 [Clostridiales bacterium GWF2_38_85]|nr:MAG: hypothetical protein A2Y17_07250 [Clostridiales bacterium GWF2_38_85]HBL85008.1 hypothetical protein [Clostridiales bacterium]
MEWNEKFPKEKQPNYTDMADYIGGESKQLWLELFDYMDKSYKAKPKMTYSCCSMKPGWNVKFQKSGQSFGTLYPEEASFSVLIVISYKYDFVMENILDKLSPKMRVQYKNAGDYMKMGRWLMFTIMSKEDLDDYKILMSVKLTPKGNII